MLVKPGPRQSGPQLKTTLDNTKSDRLKRVIQAAIVFVAILSVVDHAAAGEKKFLVVPQITWKELLPYIESHVVTELDKSEFNVFVCADRVLEDRVTSYDQELGDFAKVLIWEGMRSDRKIETSIGRATEEFRRRIPQLSESEVEKHQQLFWQDLVASADFLPRLQRLFESSERRGRLRCWMCEKNEEYRPRGLK